MINHLPILIPLLFVLGALLVPLLGMFRQAAAFWVTVATMVLATAVSAYGLWFVAAEGAVAYTLGGWVQPIGIEYILDPLSAFMCALMSAVALFVLIHARDLVPREMPGREVPFYSVALLLLTGLTGIVLTGDLFNLFVFLEISSMANYALVAIGDRRGPVAAFRYLILGTIGGSFYLLGVGFLFVETGSLNMRDLAMILPHLGDQPAVIAGLAMIVIGAGLKMALFPMHGWLPDAYTYAASSSSALISAIGTKVAAYVMIRVLFFVFAADYVSETLHFTDILAWLGAIGIIVGSILAIAQKELKRMLAYSSVGQVGYIALGIGLASPLGLIGAMLHILNHAVMKACLFLVAGNLRMQVGHSDITRFDANLRKKMPWSMAAFALASLSMIGIPPLAGFFSKWYLALGAIEQGQGVFVAVLVVSSLLNAVYFFRVLERMYLRTPEGEELPVEGSNLPVRTEVGFSMLMPTLVLAVGVLVIGLLNAIIVTQFISGMIPLGL